MSVFDAGIDSAPAAWLWTVRDKDLVELDGQLDGYDEVQLVDVDGQPGTWTVTVPLDHWAVPYLLTEGFGVVVRLPGHDEPVASGKVNLQQTTYQQATDGHNQVTVSGPTDKAILASDYAWPEPGKWLNDATSRNVVSAAVDARTGTAEDVLLGYVKDNIGSTAFHSASTTPPIDRRRNAFLTIPASSGRGTTGDFQANMTLLLDIATTICRTGGITWTIRQDSPGHLAMSVRERADVSADVVFSAAEGSLQQAVYTRQSPTVTRGIAVSDDGSARSYALAIDADAEALWGDVLVNVGDGDSAVIADLLQAAGDLIAAGAEQAGAQLQPVQLPGATTYGVDYQLGDLVTAVDGGGNSIIDRLTQVTYDHAAGSAPTLTPSVGITQEDQDSPLVPLIRQITAAIRTMQRRPR